jgi:uncharacterized membrane protein
VVSNGWQGVRISSFAQWNVMSTLLSVLINRVQSILEPSDLRLVSRGLGLETLVELLIDTVQIHKLLVLLNFLVVLLLRNGNKRYRTAQV